MILDIAFCKNIIYFMTLPPQLLPRLDNSIRVAVELAAGLRGQFHNLRRMAAFTLFYHKVLFLQWVIGLKNLQT